MASTGGIIAEAYEDDPESAKAEYGGEFRTDLADYISRETVEAVTMWGRHELPPEPGVSYSAFVDPSGGVSDSMTLAIGHLGCNNACVLERGARGSTAARPGTNGSGRVRGHAAPVRRDEDLWRQHTPASGRALALPSMGLNSSKPRGRKSDLYHDLLPLLNARRVELLDRLAALVGPACRSGAPQRRAAARISIDHVPGGHDDLANAVAGVLVGVDLDRRCQPLVKLSDVFAADSQGAYVAPPLPRHVGLMAFAVVAMEGADVAVVYAAHLKMQPPLYILDVAAGPLWRDFFTDTAAPDSMSLGAPAWRTRRRFSP